MKTKKMLISALLFAAVLPTKAQNSNTQSQGNSSGIPPTGYSIAISLGSSTPVGSFADRAQTGLNFNLSSELPIKHSHFGIALMLGGQTNGYNTSAFISAAGFSSATANNFVSDNLLVGGFATIPVHRFSFDFRLMVGSMICEYPNISATDYSGNTYQFTFTSEKVGAIDLGAGVRYNLSSKLTLMLNWNYISGANATFNGTGTFDNSISVPITITKAFSVFNATWGVGWIM